MIYICFVCLGNIVRSPLAENLFIHLAELEGVGKKYVADSAGTSAWHVGEQPDSRMRRVAAGHGLDYDGRSRQFERKDYDRFDLIIAMDQENHKSLLQKASSPEQQAKLHLMREFETMDGSQLSVPDPYYGGQEGFEAVYQIIERSCRSLLQALEKGEVDIQRRFDL